MVVIGVLIVVIVLVGLVAVGAKRRRRTPPELRGDWWPGFEREFRDYVDRTQAARPGNRRRSGGRERKSP